MPGSSNGSRRRRCGSASRAAARTSSFATASAPRHAACAVGRPGDDQVRAHAVHVERRADRGDPAQLGVGQHHRGQPGPRVGDPARRRRLDLGERRGEGRRIRLERHPPAHDLDAGVDVARRPDLDGEPEPVEQLRPQLALLRVHRPDQQERRGVRHRHPVPLDVRAAHRGGVQQEVDEVVVQQVDLVDVEHAPVRLGEQPGLVGADALGQRALQVQRPDQPVLGGADGQLDQPRRARVPGRGRRREQGQAVPPAHLGVGAVVADAHATGPGRRAARRGSADPGRPGRRRTGSPAPRPRPAAARPARAPPSTSPCPSPPAPAPRPRRGARR